MSIIYLLVFKILFSELAVSVDTGCISGVVFDDRGGALIGATVMITGTAYGAMTDRFGRYEIENIPIGTYSVTSRMPGMGESIIEGVVVIADDVVIQNFVLESRPRSRGSSFIIIKI